MTNADRIRAMDDDELAEFLALWAAFPDEWQKEPDKTLYVLRQPCLEEASELAATATKLARILDGENPSPGIPSGREMSKPILISEMYPDGSVETHMSCNFRQNASALAITTLNIVDGMIRYGIPTEEVHDTISRAVAAGIKSGLRKAKREDEADD